jgi:hypothetical protein
VLVAVTVLASCTEDRPPSAKSTPPETSTGDGTAPGTTQDTGMTTSTAGPTRLLAPGPASATGLTARADCVGTPPRPLVRLRWSPSKAGSQRIDVAATGSGLANRQFRSSAELSPDTASLTWDSAEGEAEHHWRVLTKTPAGWVPSEEATFTGPGCVGADRAG